MGGWQREGSGHEVSALPYRLSTAHLKGFQALPQKRIK